LSYLSACQPQRAEFWDAHDVIDVLGEEGWTPSQTFLDETQLTTSLTIRLPRIVKQRLWTIARSRGVSPSTLARMWLMERVYDEALPGEPK
jgi:hypothetical protein